MGSAGLPTDLEAQAGKALYLDVSGVDRNVPSTEPFSLDLGTLTAVGDINLDFEPAVVQNTVSGPPPASR